MFRYTITLVLVALLGGCATTPNASYSYFLAKSNTVASVTQTITCNGHSKWFITYSTPTVTTVNVADASRKKTIDLSDLNKWYADNDFSFNVFDDGRLKSINASWTGQGETILKSAISLGTAAVTLGGGSGSHGIVLDASRKAAARQPCDIIADWSSDGKAVSLVYTNASTPADLGLGQDILPPSVQSFELNLAQDSTSQDIYKDFKDNSLILDKPSLDVVSRTTAPDRVGFNPMPDHKAEVTLQKTKIVQYQVTVHGAPLSVGSVNVPGTNGDFPGPNGNKDTFDIPIPSAMFFGKETFALTLADDGAISTIDYGNSTGAASPLNVGAAAATAAAPPSQ